MTATRSCQGSSKANSTCGRGIAAPRRSRIAGASALRALPFGGDAAVFFASFGLTFATIFLATRATDRAAPVARLLRLAVRFTSLLSWSRSSRRGPSFPLAAEAYRPTYTDSSRAWGILSLVDINPRAVRGNVTRVGTCLEHRRRLQM